ncbi:MAG: hypothetical protein IPJ40_16725 [Saprospirales bacterium]|nr:hypothetical protein [Saprospirales bacterium]
MMTLCWVFFGFGLLEPPTEGESYSGDDIEDSDGYSKNRTELHEELPQADVEDLSVVGTATSSLPVFHEFLFLPAVKQFHGIIPASRPRFLLFHSFRFYG